jgi:hypothetical protein
MTYRRNQVVLPERDGQVSVLEADGNELLVRRKAHSWVLQVRGDRRMRRAETSGEAMADIFYFLDSGELPSSPFRQNPDSRTLAGEVQDLLLEAGVSGEVSPASYGDAAGYEVVVIDGQVELARERDGSCVVSLLTADGDWQLHGAKDTLEEAVSEAAEHLARGRMAANARTHPEEQIKLPKRNWEEIFYESGGKRLLVLGQPRRTWFMQVEGDDYSGWADRAEVARSAIQYFLDTSVFPPPRDQMSNNPDDVTETPSGAADYLRGWLRQVFPENYVRVDAARGITIQVSRVSAEDYARDQIVYGYRSPPNLEAKIVIAPPVHGVRSSWVDGVDVKPSADNPELEAEGIRAIRRTFGVKPRKAIELVMAWFSRNREKLDARNR